MEEYTVGHSNNLMIFYEYLFNGLYDVYLLSEDIATGCIDTLYKDDFIFCSGGTGCTHTASLVQTGPIYSFVGDSVLLSCNTSPTFSYQWKHNGVAINGATSSSYYAKQSGSYTVMIIENGCSYAFTGDRHLLYHRY